MRSQNQAIIVSGSQCGAGWVQNKEYEFGLQNFFRGKAHWAGFVPPVQVHIRGISTTACDATAFLTMYLPLRHSHLTSSAQSVKPAIFIWSLLDKPSNLGVELCIQLESQIACYVISAYLRWLCFEAVRCERSDL